MSQYLSRDAILAAQDFKIAEVEVPEWGGTVRVRELSAAEVDAVGFPLVSADGSIDARAAQGMMVKIVSFGVIDEDGKPVFGKNDLRELGRKAREPVRRIAGAIMDLSGMAAEEEEEGEPKNE